MTELTAHEKQYLTRLVMREHKRWSSKLDDAVSHSAIQRRDHAIRQIVALNAVILKLGVVQHREDMVGSTRESDRPTPTTDRRRTK